MPRLRLFLIASLGALALSGPGCGGSDEKYFIPADSQLRPYSPPDEEELVGDSGSEAAEAEDDDWSTDEPAGGAAAPAAPAAATPAAPAATAAEPAAPAPAKAKKPGKAGKAAKPAKPAAAKQDSGPGAP